MTSFLPFCTFIENPNRLKIDKTSELVTLGKTFYSSKKQTSILKRKKISRDFERKGCIFTIKYKRQIFSSCKDKNNPVYTVVLHCIHSNIAWYSFSNALNR